MRRVITQLGSAVALFLVVSGFFVIEAQAAPGDMVIIVDTALSAGNTVTLPLRGDTDVQINWGDGTATTTVTNADQTTDAEHTYSIEGEYTILMSGELEQFGGGLGSYDNADKLTEVTSFGDLGITSLFGAFVLASNLTAVPSQLPNSVTDISGMFAVTSSFNQAIGTWDTSGVTRMFGTFSNATAFNQDLSAWDTSNVTEMKSMFTRASAFNGDISAWDTSSVTNMDSMFDKADAFNSDIGTWDTSQVESMIGMFNGASAFNGDISAWDTNSVADMGYMFENATSFDQDLSNWCVSLVDTEPVGFDTGASAWTGGSATRPQWGTCPATLPGASTGVVAASTYNSLSLNGAIYNSGQSTSTERGFIYSTDSTFDTGVATSTETGVFTTGAYSATITGLAASTTYYYQAYARNSTGYGYGSSTSATTSGPQVWDNTDWTLYDTITIDADNIDEDLIDFPVYVDLADLSSQFWSTTPTATSTVGTDIRVTTDDGTLVELPRELVKASSTTQTGELHFKADSISSTTDTVFRIWYNGNTAGDYMSDAANGRNAVWSDYTFVLHLNDATTTAVDSSGNTDFAYQGDTFGTTGNLPLGGVSFDGNGDQLEATTAVFAGDQDPLTYQMWMNPNTLSGGMGLIGEFSDATEWARNYWLVNGFADTLVYEQYPRDTGDNAQASSGVLSVDTAYMLHIAKNSDVVRQYKNGEIIGSPISHIQTYTGSTPEITWIGNRNEACCDASFDGDIDEVRARTSELSPAWIKAEYTNQSSADFYSTVGEAVVYGSSTISNHDDTQVPNQFDFQNKTDETLYAFKLTPDSGVATVTELTLSLEGVKNIRVADFSNWRLYRDYDDNAQFGGSDVAVGGSGVMSIDGQSGTVVFNSDFIASTSLNYIVVADWNAPDRQSSVNIVLRTTGVTMRDTAGTQIINGEVSSVQHNRLQLGGGGGGSSSIGDTAPAGDGDVGGGTTGGGDAIDTNTDGGTIGNSADYYRPSAQSGSWTSPVNAYDQTDGTYAEDSNGVTHSYSDFNDPVPGGDTVAGVAVKLEISGTTAAGNIDVQLSWDGGTSFTASKSTPVITTTDTVVKLGGVSDTWGRTWSASEFTNDNFVVRLTGNVSSNTIRVDEIQVKVYHQSSGGSSGGGGAGGAI